MIFLSLSEMVWSTNAELTLHENKLWRRNSLENDILWKVSLTGTELKFHLCKKDLILESTTALYQSQNLTPILTTISGKPLESVNRFLEYNSACHCWILNNNAAISDLVQTQEFIIACKLEHNYSPDKIHSTRWSIMQFRDMGATSDTGILMITTIFSASISKKVLFHPCRPHVAIFVSGRNAYITYNNFETSNQLKIYFPKANVRSLSITGVNLALDKVIWIVNNELFISDYTDQFFYLKHVKSPNKIVGVTQSLLCYRDDDLYWPKENYNVFIWSEYQIHFVKFLSDNDTYELVLKSTDIFNGETKKPIAFLKHNSHPEEVLIAYDMVPDLKFYVCRFSVLKSIMTCEATTTEKTLYYVSGLSTFEVANCQKFCGFIVSPHGLSHIDFNSKQDSVLARTAILSYAHNEDLTLWIFVSRKYWLIYNSDGVFKHRKLIPNGLDGFTPKLQSFQHIELLNCNPDCEEVNITTISVTESTNMELKYDTTPMIVNVNTNQNLFTITNLNQVIDIHGFISTYTKNPFSFDVQYELGDTELILSSETEIVTSLATTTKSTTLLFSLDVKINCKKEKILNCGKGVAKIILNFIPKFLQTKAVMIPSKTMFINVTCPADIKLILGPLTTGGGCTNLINNEKCVIVIREKDLVHLSFELYLKNTKLADVKDDVFLMESNHRTGFFINNQYVLSKDCFMCDQFYNLTSPSQIVLQTVDSACPCKKDLFHHNTWTGNISFLGAVTYTNNEDIFNFDVEVKDTSLCDHRTSFIIKVVNQPSPLFQLWEYLLIAIFFGITIVALVISYKNYITFMKLNKEKASATNLKESRAIK